jgi:hypothetical protein
MKERQLTKIVLKPEIKTKVNRRRCHTNAAPRECTELYTEDILITAKAPSTDGGDEFYVHCNSEVQHAEVGQGSPRFRKTDGLWVEPLALMEVDRDSLPTLILMLQEAHRQLMRCDREYDKRHPKKAAAA